MLLTRLGQGREAEVFAWADGFVLKLFWPEFSRHDAEWEAGLARQVWLLGVPTPRVEDLLEVDGRWGVVYEWAKGVPLTDYLAADPGRLSFAAQMLGAFHRQLHGRAAAQLPSQRAKLARGVESSPLSKNLKNRLLKHLRRLPDGSALCHGDFHPENVLIADEGVTVIDWPNAVRGNPAADVARTVLLLRHAVLPPDLPAKELIEQGRERLCEEYLEHYATFSGLDRDELEAWMPVVAAARLREGIEGERERLMRLVTEGVARAVR